MEQVAVKAWGNSQGIRIPKAILEKLNIKVSDTLHKSFEERVAEYNGEISVCAYDWGEPVGKEML